MAGKIKNIQIIFLLTEGYLVTWVHGDKEIILKDYFSFYTAFFYKHILKSNRVVFEINTFLTPPPPPTTHNKKISS